MRVRAPGKVNLSLAVGRRRDDGFHGLATVFQAVSVYEEVVATESDAFTAAVTGRQAEEVPTGEGNLAVRAAMLLADATGTTGGVHLDIHKDVPVAGGMAGGSADAAATLVACDALWRTGLSRTQLAELAAALGSDVPFALHGHTAVGRGRGHLLSPVLTRGAFHWVFGLHRSGLSTAHVYGAFDEIVGRAAPEEPELPEDLMRALRSADPVALGAALTNDLQHAALELAPELAETLAVAQDAGALGVVVSGSGPTVAALAVDRVQGQAIATALVDAGVVDDVLHAVGPVAGARVLSPAGADGLRA